MPPNQTKTRDPRDQASPDQIKPSAPIFVGSLLESESYFKSPYYRDSYYFPWNPDPLCHGNDYRIYDEMCDDDQIKVAISFKKDIVVNSGWQLVCDRPDVKAYVEEALKRMQEEGSLQTSFEDTLRDMLSAYEYGFSLSEPVFKIKDNAYTVESIRVRPPQSFRFVVDKYGTTNEVAQMSSDGEIKFDPRLFIHHVYQPQYSNPYGKSDLRAAYVSWKAKKFISRFLAIYLERFGSPMPVAKYPAGMDTNEVGQLAATLKTIQQTSSLTLPDNVMVDFVQANKDSADIYIKSLDYYNMHIGRALLVPDLLGISGQKTGGGSFALGRDQFTMFLATLEKDRSSLARKITLRLVNPLVHANFGPGIKCDFEFLPFAMDQNVEMLKTWGDLVRFGVFRPNDDEINHVRSEISFPNGPVILGEVQVKKTPGVDVNGPSGQPLGGQPGNPPAAPGPTVPAEQPKGLFASKPSRQVTGAEKKVDFAQIQKSMDRADELLRGRLKRTANQIWRDLAAQVKDSGLIRNFNPERLNGLKPRFLRDMNQEFKGGFRDLLEQAYSEARRELFPKDARNFGLDEGELGYEDMVAVLDAEAFNITADYAGLASKKVNAIIAQGLKQQLSESEIMDLIREELPDDTDTWINTLLRTKTTEIYNRGRKSYFDNDEMAQQVIDGYQFSAVLDARTTDVCRSLDKKVFKSDDDNINLLTPPLHWNCRSVIVPVTIYEKDDMEDAQEVPDRAELQAMGATLLSENSEVKA